MKVKKAIFPVAGFGTRFLPATKANPKEMLPIVDKPLIQYAVEEAIKAGIKDLIFITNSSKRAIEDHFDTNFELEHTLQAQGKTDLLHEIKNIIPEGINCIYLRQQVAKGLGHAVLCAKSVVGDEPFAVILADDLIHNNQENCLSQMLNSFYDLKSSIIAIEEIDKKYADKYGIIAYKDPFKVTTKIDKIVEKPKPELAPSNYAAVGRYIFTPNLFSYLETTKPGNNNEIQLTDAIASMIADNLPVFAHKFAGKRFDCGSKLGFLQATCYYAMQDNEVKDKFAQFLQNSGYYQ